MKNYYYFSIAALVLAGCANDEIVDNGGKDNREVPIIMSANKSNITRATTAPNLETNKHYNFGVWAQKTKSSGTAAQTVMMNYLVGYGGTNVGYEHTNSTTHAAVPGTTDDHTSPWFYEGLGNTEYTYSGTEGYYTSSQEAYMSANANQYLRYWDLAYTNTYFYCYAPYMASGVTTTMNTDGSATMKFSGTTLRDGYDCALNSVYKQGTDANPTIDRSLSEFMYAGHKAINSDLKDIKLSFKHMGAQLFIRFYEEVPGYKVEILDLDGDGGTMKAGVSEDQKKGIQATPSVKPSTGTTYSTGKYYNTSGATVSFATDATGSLTSDFDGSTQTEDNLMFYAPSTTLTYSDSNVPTGFGHNLDSYTGLSSTIHNVIKEKAATGSTQNYSWSPTIYYPVAQPSAQETGFTFHVTYRIIAEDNQEVITVHNATVFVPAATSDATPVSIARWKAGKRYIYTFKITRDATGTTNPGTEIDPTNPTPGTEKSLYPIVFDGCTIDDYIDSDSEHEIK